MSSLHSTFQILFMEVVSSWLQVSMDYTFKLEQFSSLFVSFDLSKVISLDSTILDLRLPLGIGILLMLFGYFFSYAFIGGVVDSIFLKISSWNKF